MTTFTYSDLIRWARERLPAWQQDALRRLLEGQGLTSQDVDDLSALALAAHDGGPATLLPVPPGDDIELAEAAHPCITLAAVRDIQRVNALGAGPLTFAPTGLTLIYGGNAAGKSGVARILKKSCHARDPGGAVLPNVFEADPGQPASASIDFLVDDDPKTHLWVDGAARELLLRPVNVFDSACALVQVEKANKISYTPEILQIFRSLASAVDRVAAALRSKSAALGIRPPSLSTLALDANTEAGKFITTLSRQSKVEALEALCALTPADRARIAELDRALADDPLKRATAEESRSRRVGELADVIVSASRIVADEARTAFEAILAERDKAQLSAAAAREAFAEKSDLAGIGSDAWRSLWESARQYSRTHAYVGEAFPVVGEHAACVLCQQPLSADAAARVHSFEEFVQADVQQKADKAASALADASDRIRSLKIPRSVRRELREAGLIDSTDGQEARRFLVLGKLARRHLLRLIAGGTTGVRHALPPAPNLQPIKDQVMEEAARLQAASRASERKAMEGERAELKAREKLAPHLETLRSEIRRLKQAAVFDRALDDCKTQPITLKNREAAASVLTDRLRSNFQGDLLRLGLADSPVEIKLGAGEHGEHPVELRLVARPDVRPEEVLSEGERTCVALAGLLAELETTGNRSALVLDDPISSLDHQYRKRVAERLVRAAAVRQVIIFTHDIVFLYLLRKYQAELGVSLTETSLERGYRGGHARVKQGAPWVAMSVKERIKVLREDLVEARRILKGGDRTEYERRASDLYKRLRMTWERAIEEVLLNQTVVRFGDSVQTKRLAKLTDITDADVEHVNREMSRCSDFEHDESGAVYAAPPEPDVVEADITLLDDWAKELRTMRGRN